MRDANGGDDAGDGPPDRPQLPGPLLRFLELFDREEFWESHEALEDAWRETGSRFYHGLILYASAFVHAQRETPHGIVAQLEKAERALEPYRPAYLGLDVEGLLRHGRRCRELVERRREGRAVPGREPPDSGRAASWATLVPFPRLRPDTALIRGDEPELRGA